MTSTKANGEHRIEAPTNRMVNGVVVLDHLRPRV